MLIWYNFQLYPVVNLVRDDDFNTGEFKQAVQDGVGLLVRNQAVNFFRTADVKQRVAMHLPEP